MNCLNKLDPFVHRTVILSFHTLNRNVTMNSSWKEEKWVGLRL